MYKLRIWKPGSGLADLLQQDGDATHFGGLSELRYFVDYFGALPINSVSEITTDDVVLISNCNPRFHDETRSVHARKIVQIVSDLNLTIPDEILGDHTKLCQIPYPNERDWYYSSIEKSILLFQKPNHTSTKKYMLVYGGGARNGNRDKQYAEFLDPVKDYVSLIFTSSDILHKSPKLKDKVTFNELQHTYAVTKYGIVISDPQYYDAGMLTQRYWEYCLNDMVAFIDSRYDKFNALIGQSNFVRVRDSIELQEKIEYLEGCPEERAQILSKQRQMIDKEIDFMKGENITSLKKLIFAGL